MTKQYDLVVVGAGTAAMTAAMQVRAAGKHVAVIDFRPFGGTCALRGCDPKKCGSVERMRLTMRGACRMKASPGKSISIGSR